MRDQLVSAASHLDDAMEATARDLTHRAQGLMAEARSTVSDEEVSDEVLVDRVRAKIGRVVSHPGAIKVTAEQGRVILSGAVLEHGHEELLQAVRSVRGGSRSRIDWSRIRTPTAYRPCRAGARGQGIASS